jgi:hypothetical protein
VKRPTIKYKKGSKMKKIKCEVYDVENPENKTFFVQANENYGGRIYPTGKEIILPEICINVLKDCVIDTWVRNPETNKAERYVKPRFRVIVLGEAESATPSRNSKESR